MTTEMARMTSRLLLVPILVIAAAVLVKGGSQVGDGFTAGLIAALAVVVQYLAAGPEATERWLPARHGGAIAVAGLLLLLATALEPLARGEPLLTHAPPPGAAPVELGKLKLTTHLLVELGIFLLVLGAALAAIRSIFRAARSAEEGS